MSATTPLDCDTMPASTDFYDRNEVAALAGIKPDSVTVHVNRARLYIAEHGEPKPGQIPLPDGWIGRAPWWRKERIDAWLPQRLNVGEH